MSEGRGKSRSRRRCWFAAHYDRFMAALEQVLGPARRELLLEAGSAVLELGFGTGANWALRPVTPPCYVGLEPDRGMLAVARRKFSRFPLLVQGEAEDQGFASGSFDTVLATLVLCTVTDPERVMREICRVLAPGGRLLYLEHVRGGGLHGRFQDLVTPLWRRPACGCHLNRQTEKLIQAAGLRIERRRELNPLQFLPAPARWLGNLAGPWVAGVARRP